MLAAQADRLAAARVRGSSATTSQDRGQRTSCACSSPPSLESVTSIHCSRAGGLRRRGHGEAFASGRSFASDIEAAGFTSFAAGRDWLTAEMGQALPDMALHPPGPARYAWARATVFAGHTAQEAVPDLLAVARSWHPELIVREAAEYGGCLAAEVLGLPHAVVRTDSGSSSYADRGHVAASLNAARARFGLPPDPDTAMPFRYLQLSFAPEGFDDPAGTPPRRVATSNRWTPARRAPDPSRPGGANFAIDRPSTPRSASSTTPRPSCLPPSSTPSPPSPSTLSSPSGLTRTRSSSLPSPPTSISNAGSPNSSCCPTATSSSPMVATAPSPRP